jgi:uncharacterized OB-fold protein
MSEPPIPPRRHGHLALALGEQKQEGTLSLLQCERCGRIDYPLRELCSNCLSDRMAWRRVDPSGTVLAAATLRRSNEPHFRDRLPLRIGSVQLRAGPVVIAWIEHEAVVAGTRVTVAIRLDASGAGSLVVAPAAVPDPAPDAPNQSAVGS